MNKKALKPIGLKAFIYAIYNIHTHNTKYISCRFFHPDFTVGSGISPDHAFRLAGSSVNYKTDIPPVGNCTLPETYFIYL